MCEACVDVLERRLEQDVEAVEALRRFMFNGTILLVNHFEPFQSLKLEAARPGAWISTIVHGSQGSNDEQECESMMVGWARLDWLERDLGGPVDE